MNNCPYCHKPLDNQDIVVNVLRGVITGHKSRWILNAVMEKGPSGISMIDLCQLLYKSSTLYNANSVRVLVSRMNKVIKQYGWVIVTQPAKEDGKPVYYLRKVNHE